ncbi:MAG TPA: hypothetical protein DDZ83_02375, partial [Nitrospinae bacterium]|nr:hypothetical protein [Nitrospinota bacterium]
MDREKRIRYRYGLGRYFLPQPDRLPDAQDAEEKNAHSSCAGKIASQNLGGVAAVVDDALCDLSVFELSGKIKNRSLSPAEIVEALLGRIEALNEEYLGFLTVTGELAMEEARRAGDEIAAGRYRGPLHGIPYGAKDIIDTAGIRTTNGSSFHRDNVPAEDAEVIARLKRAGAILIGKTHTHEFAAASTTINPHWGTSHNPWNPERIVGGSSGGSAAAVSAGMIPAALGTDTGGSVRTPAAFCGIVGL